MQPSANRFRCGHDAAGEDGLQISGSQRDPRERAENRFCGLSPDHAFVSRQQEHRLVTSRREDETGRTERRNCLESHRGWTLEAGNEPSAQTPTAGTPAQPQFGRERSRTAARRT